MSLSVTSNECIPVVWMHIYHFVVLQTYKVESGMKEKYGNNATLETLIKHSLMIFAIVHTPSLILSVHSSTLDNFKTFCVTAFYWEEVI